MTLGPVNPSIGNKTDIVADHKVNTEMNDAIVRSFRVATILSRPGQNKSVRSLSFSKCGSLLASSFTNDVIEIYDSDQGLQTSEIFTGRYGHGIVRFGSTEQTIVHSSSKEDHALRSLDIAAKKYHTYFYGHTDEVVSLDVSKVDPTFVTGSRDGLVLLWDMRISQARGSLGLGGKPIACIDPNGMITAVGINSEMIQLYDLRSFGNGPFAEFRVTGDNIVCEWTNLEFSPDSGGKHLAIGTNSTTVHLVDSINGTTKTFRSRENKDQVPIDVTFTPDAQYLLSGGSNGQICVWNVSTGFKLTQLDSAHMSKELITRVEFNPVYAMFATGSSHAVFWSPSMESLEAAQQADSVE